MKFGVVGLGSMGKRRVRDLVTAGHQVLGFDVREDRNDESRSLFGIETVPRFEDLSGHGVEAVFICTPPDQHVPYYEACFGRRLPFFSEANILTPTASWFAEREARSGVSGSPSATWRFYPLFRSLKRELDLAGLTTVNSVHHHYGGYLPSWHPWESYADFYAGHKQTSAAREMVPFEMEWLVWMLGPLRAVCAVHQQAFPWSTDMDDSYFVLLEFQAGMRGTLIAELHQVAPFRMTRVACREHSYTVDLAAHELLKYSPAEDCWRRIKPEGMRALGSFDFEDVYRSETAAYVEALLGGNAFPKTWEDDRHLSDILVAAEESWRRREWVTIEEASALYDGLSWT